MIVYPICVFHDQSPFLFGFHGNVKLKKYSNNDNSFKTTEAVGV